MVQVTKSRRPAAPSKSKVPMTSTWSLGLTIPETLAAPEQFTETARMFFLMSAGSDALSSW